jgi:hypothetical protein
MLDGIMLLWFVLTAASVLFVAIDIRTTPESPVMKWGFVLVTAFTGVFGAFLYVLGCREPLPNTHERYVASQWRQTLGSTMHCAAGDAIGILAGAVLATAFNITGLAEIALEYVLGFGFGWSVFQALFMRDMAGGSYSRALASTFLPEMLSMNLLMAGMVPTMMILRALIAKPAGPTTPVFWFVMSMALTAGFAAAYPINWWLVRNKLKHGMLTIRPASAMPANPMPGHGGQAMHGGMQEEDGRGHAAMRGREPSQPSIPTMAALSFVALGAGVIVALIAAHS